MRSPSCCIAAILCLLAALLPAGRCLGEVGSEVEAALLANDWDAVVATLEADESTPGDPIASMVLCMIYDVLDRLDESDAWYSVAAQHENMRSIWREWTVDFLEKHPEAPVALYLAADANIMVGDHEAKKQLEKAIKIDKEFVPTYFCQARYYSAIREPNKAVDALKKLIKLRPEHLRAYRTRGTLYLDIGKEKDAIKDFDKLLELDPADIDALQNRGSAHLAGKKYDEALADYTSALELAPGRAMLHNNIGFVYYRMDDYDRAMSEFAAVMADSIDEDDDELARGYAYTTIGRIHEAQGDSEQALLDYTSAIELAPNHSVPYTQRGLIYLEKLDDEEKACADFRRACELGDCHNFHAGVQRGMCE